jgi:O-6-methylguanine DNA methyltransferase
VSALRVETPLGAMLIRCDEAGAVTHALFRDEPGLAEGDGPVADAFRAWFGGDLAALEALALAPAGSGFQRSVWAELRRIPPGETRSYADIARSLGGAASGPGPNARAVGTANAQNPIAIAIPCHRVIGADGRLTGYAGGLERKAWLLAHEGWAPAQKAFL